METLLELRTNIRHGCNQWLTQNQKIVRVHHDREEGGMGTQYKGTYNRYSWCMQDWGPKKCGLPKNSPRSSQSKGRIGSCIRSSLSPWIFHPISPFSRVFSTSSLSSQTQWEYMRKMGQIKIFIRKGEKGQGFKQLCGYRNFTRKNNSIPIPRQNSHM